MSSRGRVGSLRRATQIVAVVAAVALLAIGGLYFDVLPHPHGGKTAVEPPSPGQPTPAAPHVALPKPPSAGSVLDPPAPAAFSPRLVARRLAHAVSAAALGPHRVVAVAGLWQTGLLWRVGHPATVVPASLTKTLTTTAALAELGPDARFFTTVVAGPRRGSLVLVGGGDPLLTVTAPTGAASTYPQPATLRDLARQTAAALKGQGVRRVRLGYDHSLFTGPAVNPHWRPSYIRQDVVSPITALWVNEGRETPESVQRVAHPALFAAEKFAAQLGRFGVQVVAAPTSRGVPTGAVQVASVESPPLAQIVEHVIAVSDNEGAEVLLRQVAIGAGLTGSAANGVQAVEHILGRLGMPLAGARLYDGSGLSRQDRLPVRSIVAALQLAAAPDHPDLRALLTGLPVAGFDGSLGYRFVDDSPGGVGLVRAKTGTLTGVDGLAGLVLTHSDQVAVFVAAADKVRVPKTLAARADLDRIATALSRCGC